MLRGTKRNPLGTTKVCGGLYIQESERAGRDGNPSKALLLYQPLMLLRVEKDMKDYVKGKYTCQREFLMGHFDEKGRKSRESELKVTLFTVAFAQRM